VDRWAVLGGVLGNRQGECLSGTWLGSIQHPLYLLRMHSRASFCAAERSKAITSLFAFPWSNALLFFGTPNVPCRPDTTMLIPIPSY
jgi:hypothetical protein